MRNLSALAGLLSATAVAAQMPSGMRPGPVGMPNIANIRVDLPPPPSVAQRVATARALVGKAPASQTVRLSLQPSAQGVVSATEVAEIASNLAAVALKKGGLVRLAWTSAAGTGPSGQVLAQCAVRPALATKEAWLNWSRQPYGKPPQPGSTLVVAGDIASFVIDIPPGSAPGTTLRLSAPGRDWFFGWCELSPLGRTRSGRNRRAAAVCRACSTSVANGRYPAAMRLIASVLALAAAVAVAGTPPTVAKDRRGSLPAARMPPLRPAVIDDTLAIGGDEIAARKLRSRLTVDVGVNGTGPYRFVVDSGADSSVIGARLAAALALKTTGSVILNGITETRRVERVGVDSLQLGPTAFRDLELPRLDERDIGAAGMIGLDALVEQRLMLDFEKRRIAVEDASKPTARLDGEIVVTARMKRGQLILTQVTANRLPLDAIIDTGSEITIGNLALRDRIIRRKLAEMQKIEVIGVTGKEMTLDLAVVNELKLGGVVMNNVPIAFADVPPFEVFGLHKGPALLLGTDMMENFRRISLDFRNRKVRFQLKSCQRSGFILNATNTAARIAAEKGNQAVCR